MSDHHSAGIGRSCPTCGTQMSHCRCKSERVCSLCRSENNRSITVLADGMQLCRECSDKLDAWRRALDDDTTEALGGPVPQRCPRRDEMFQQGGDPNETPDEWRQIHGLYRCTYCGSLHPDFFIVRVRHGEEIGPTDKNYKVYVGPDHAKFYFQHLAPGHAQAFIDALNVKNGHADLAPPGTAPMNVGYPGHFYVEPYFLVKRAPESGGSDPS